MKKIYLLLMHTHTMPAKAVKLFTGYKYSHVALSLDKQCNTVYSFGRKRVNSILDGGFSIENRDGMFFKKFNNTQCKIYEAVITDEQYESIEKNFENMKHNIDEYKYDFLGIVPRFFKVPVTFKNRYVCSQFIATVLDKEGICTFSNDICFATPRDFERLEGFKHIYEGNYLEYDEKLVGV